MNPKEIEAWISQTGPDCDESKGVPNVFGARPLDTSSPPRPKRKASSDQPYVLSPVSKKLKVTQPIGKSKAKEMLHTTAGARKRETNRDCVEYFPPLSVTSAEQNEIDALKCLITLTTTEPSTQNMLVTAAALAFLYD